MGMDSAHLWWCIAVDDVRQKVEEAVSLPCTFFAFQQKAVLGLHLNGLMDIPSSFFVHHSHSSLHFNAQPW